MSTVHRQPGGRDAIGGLLQAVWRYKWLIAVVVLLGALLGYGWAARQPTLYEGTSRIHMAYPCLDMGNCVSPIHYLRHQAVLQRAVKLSGSRISAETLGQRLEVEVADAYVATIQVYVMRIRVVDSTAKGAAQLANAVVAAYEQFFARQARERTRSLRSQLEARRSQLKTRLAAIHGRLAGRPDDSQLRGERNALAAQLSHIERRVEPAVLEARVFRLAQREVAAVPEQPIQPRPRRTVAIGMLLGLLVSAVLVWWLTRRHGPTASAPEPEMPSPSAVPPG